MNERLLELAKQAKIEFTYDPTETPMRAFAECWEDELEKFAELIVRECISKIGDVYKDALDDDIEDWDRGFLGGLSCAMDTVQKHFGVENERKTKSRTN